MPLPSVGCFPPFGYKSLSRQRFLLLGHLTFDPTKQLTQMKTQKIISVASATFIGFSAFAIVSGLCLFALVLLSFKLRLTDSFKNA
jgi:hypothetical protein